MLGALAGGVYAWRQRKLTANEQQYPPPPR
jgi:hypothetical protein